MMKQETAPKIVSISAADSRPHLRIDALLDNGGQTKAMRATLLGIVGIAVVFIAWSVVANVDELAKARGEIQPSGHVQNLQTEEGGSIVKLYVKEGDSVHSGQLIAEFAATNLDKEKEQNAIKISAVSIDRERLSAILEDRKPEFSKFADSPRLVEHAQVIYSSQIASRDAMVAAKRSEGSQQGILVGGLEIEKKMVDRELKESRDRLVRLEDGARKGVVTQLALSEARQQLIILESHYSDVNTRANSMRNTMGGVNFEVARMQAEFKQQISSELSKGTEQWRELLAEQKILIERDGRSDLKANIDGIVMNLPQTAVGAVVAPGGVVAEIVPTGQEVIMEAMITPRDIGFVKEGQRAMVKIDAYDYARFGAIEGKVKRVSATSFKMKENGAPFYKVDIALANPYVGTSKHYLVPGMTGEADIATGHKSVMQYLLKPVFTAADTAFHER
jgi:adhesin transport system membrane fusion protein